MGLAIFTYAIKVHPVELRRKPVPLDEPDLKVFYLFVDDFDEAAAVRADKVIVVAVPVQVLVPGGAVLEPDFAAEPALAQQFERPVYRGVSHGGIFLLHRGPQFFDGKMPFYPEENVQNPQAGLAVPESFAAEEFFEDDHFFHTGAR
jgi:hypothetical protein